jgi:hypothetical protein
MMLLVRHIAVLALVFGYAGGTFQSLSQIPDLMSSSAGPKAITTAHACGKAAQKPVWTQRRYLPLVQQGALSVAEPVGIPFPDASETHTHLSHCPVGAFLSSAYYSSCCNKAPPRA